MRRPDTGTVARPNKWLHWSLAALMLGLIALGAWMVDLSYYHPQSQRALSLHRQLGVLAGVLALLALLWRVYSPLPPHLLLPRWQQCAAGVVHALLWFFLLTLPLSGYLLSGSAGEAIPLVGGMSLPALLALDDETAARLADVHRYLAYGCLGLVVLHALAALKHHFIDRDDTLRRML